MKLNLNKTILTLINKKTISSLLTCRDVQGIPLTRGFVTAVLGAASLILQKAGQLANEEEKNQGTPGLLSDVWDMHSGSVYSGLSAVLSNKDASVVLMQKVVDRFH
jgi:3-hydroxy-3-methylglutaryl CoA synthase